MADNNEGGGGNCDGDGGDGGNGGGGGRGGSGDSRCGGDSMIEATVARGPQERQNKWPGGRDPGRRM